MTELLNRVMHALGFVSISEVAAASKFEADLRALTTDEEDRAEIREAALTAAKLGATSQEIDEALSYWHRHRLRSEYDAHRITTYVNEILLGES